MSRLDIIEQEVKKISQCRVSYYSFIGQGCNDHDLERLVEAINRNPNIETVDLSENNLEDCMDLLKLEHVEKLILDYNSIGDQMALELINKFKRLYLRNNALTKKIVENVGKFNNQCIELELTGHRALTPDLLKIIQQKIETNKSADKSADKSVLLKMLQPREFDSLSTTKGFVGTEATFTALKVK